MEYKDVDDILFGKTFKERFITILPILVGCIFIWLVSFSITNIFLRYSLICYIIYCIVYLSAEELVFRVQDFLESTHQVTKD